MKINMRVFFENNFADITTKQKCKRILYYLCLFMVIPIWFPSAVIFMAVEALMDFFREKLYYC